MLSHLVIMMFNAGDIYSTHKELFFFPFMAIMHS